MLSPMSARLRQMGATGTTDIAEKVGNVVQEAEAIKQKAETTYHSAEKLQKNVERFIV